MIDLKTDHLDLVKRILTEHVPECEVRAYGSRVNGRVKEYSDLDLVILCGEKIDRRRMGRLREAFAESDLPFRVEVQDWQTISESFREIIEKQYEILQKP